MGRKIPGKKHRNIKDPVVQNERRKAAIANKINAPPSCIDYQEIPQSALRLMELRNSVREGKFKRKKKKKKTGDFQLIDTRKLMPKDVILPGMTRPEKTFPVVVQAKGESKSRFIRRVDRKCLEIIQEVQFENKFNVEVKRNIDTGVVESVEKRKKSDVDEIEEKSKNIKKKKKSSLKKWEKLEAKKLAKAQVKSELDNERDFHHLKDEIKFGDVVHQPPELIMPRLKTKQSELAGRRPGSKELLLSSLLITNEAEKNHRKTSSSNCQERKLKKKRKVPVDAAKQRVLEEERRQVVEAYRLLKKKKIVT